jgi:hypothetical protein
MTQHLKEVSEQPKCFQDSQLLLMLSNASGLLKAKILERFLKRVVESSDESKDRGFNTIYA